LAEAAAIVKDRWQKKKRPLARPGEEDSNLEEKGINARQT
jgi:hypothetical protein